MDLNSKSCVPELRPRFYVSHRRLAPATLLSSAALLRARCSLRTRMCRRFCSVLTDDAVPVLRFRRGFCCRSTGIGVLPGRRSRVRFLGALCAFFLFFLGRFLDSGQLAQNLHALLGSLSPPR